MNVTSTIRDRINTLPQGITFGYNDLGIAKDKYVTAAKALERLQKEGLLKKISKGVFYKPKQSVFGELKPNYDELLRPFLYENGKRIAYETGTTLFNKLGLTTQMAFRIKIASRGKRISINRGTLKADPVKSYAEVTDENYEILGLLDAFKEIKNIPDCSVEKAINRLRAIVTDLCDEQVALLINYAIAYPPRVRAVVGAILEYIGYEEKLLEELRESLKPLTTIKLGIENETLPTINNWNIR